MILHAFFDLFRHDSRKGTNALRLSGSILLHEYLNNAGSAQDVT